MCIYNELELIACVPTDTMLTSIHLCSGHLSTKIGMYWSEIDLEIFLLTSTISMGTVLQCSPSPPQQLAGSGR